MGLLFGLFPELFEGKLMDRITLLQHDRWTCDETLLVTLSGFLPNVEALGLPQRAGELRLLPIRGRLVACYLLVQSFFLQAINLLISYSPYFRSASRVCSWTHGITQHALAALTPHRGA